MLFATLSFIILAPEVGAEPWYAQQYIWKTFNLMLFAGVLYFLLRGPISKSLHTRRETIRRDLMRAQEERNAALAKLQEVDARLARLDSEVEVVREQARKEAVEERQRVTRATEDETRKLREQARQEIESTAKLARYELRLYAAEQSVRLAEGIIRRDMNPEDDMRLVSDYVQELEGVRQ